MFIFIIRLSVMQMVACSFKSRASQSFKMIPWKIIS